MNPSDPDTADGRARLLSIASRCFGALAWLLGAPSVVAVGGAAWIEIGLRLRDVPASGGFGDRPDALLLMLQGITGVARALGGAIDLLAHAAALVLAVAGGAGLVLAVGCWAAARVLRVRRWRHLRELAQPVNAPV